MFESHNIIVIAPTVLDLGGQVVEALGFRMHGHELNSHIRSSFFFFYFYFSQIHDNGPVRVIKQLRVGFEVIKQLNHLIST